jgi:hypothetical protein
LSDGVSAPCLGQIDNGVTGLVAHLWHERIKPVGY